MVSRKFKTIKMKEEEKENEKEYCNYCDEFVEDEHICFTCCGDEITGEVEDLGLCPTCLEHI